MIFLLKVSEITVINPYLITTLKGTSKATTEDVLKLNTLRGTETAFLTPKRYDEHPHHFYMGDPWGAHSFLLDRLTIRDANGLSRGRGRSSEGCPLLSLRGRGPSQ